MPFKVLARLGFPPKIPNLVRLFHGNVPLEVDLDDRDDSDGNTIIVKYNIGVKQGDTLAPVLFLCYIQAVLETLFPKFEAAPAAVAAAASCWDDSDLVGPATIFACQTRAGVI